MKKFIVLLLSVSILLVSFAGCNKTESKDPTDSFQYDEGKHGLSEEELSELINPNFSPEVFEAVEEGIELTYEEVKAIIAKVPSDKYEAYPKLHTVPNTATLYKNGEVISIDVKDPRLIGLINLYNNSVHYSQLSYTQGLYNSSYIKRFEDYKYKLVLTYTPQESTGGNQKCNAIIITNDLGFCLLAHALPGYEDLEEDYPFWAFGHAPLHEDYPWLELFGF